MPDDFFKQEMRLARAALRNSVKEAGRSLQEKSDISPWVCQRPFVSLAAAVAGGAVAGYLLVPSRHKGEAPPEEHRREKRRQHAEAEDEDADQERGFVAGLRRQVLKAITPAMRTAAATAAGAVFHGVGASNGEGREGAEGREGTEGRRGRERHGEDYAELPQHRIQL